MAAASCFFALADVSMKKNLSWVCSLSFLFHSHRWINSEAHMTWWDADDGDDMVFFVVIVTKTATSE